MMSEMSNVPENIERLIVRKLDVGLSEEDQLALDRAVLRDPEARQMLDSYAQIDRLAADALGQQFGAIAEYEAFGQIQSRAGLPVRRYARAWWLLPAAAAAVLAAALVPRGGHVPLSGNGAALSGQNANGMLAAGEPRPQSAGSAGIEQAGTLQPALRDRSINQDVYYVVGDDGKIYLLERKHVQQLTRPGNRDYIKPAGGL